MRDQSTIPTKTCTKCGEAKPLDDFHFADKKTGARFARCKDCINADTLRAYHEKRAGTWKPRTLPPIPSEKACSVCGVTKPLSAFSVQGAMRDGHRSNCKECGNAAARAYAKAHPDRVKENQARYVAAHPEERRDTYVRSNEKRRDSGWTAQYVREHAEERRVYHAKWYAENRERVRAIAAQWDRDNNEARKTIGERWRANKVNAQINDFTLEQWQATLEYFNGYCAYCGEPCDAMEQEHMMPLSRGGDHTTSNIVPSCRSCNGRKHAKTLAELLLAS